MHDVLDPRDLVPDEAEQLRISGYPVGDLEQQAAQAAAVGDLEQLTAVETALSRLARQEDWPYEEPEDDATLLALARAVPRRPVDAEQLPDRLRGAWLGRAVGNTMGKPIEGLTRPEVEAYLRAAGQWPQQGYLPLLDPLPDGVPHLHPSAPVATAGRFRDVPRDDDIDWTILGLHLVEQYGEELTTHDVGQEWLDRVPFTQTFTAERAAYRNLIHGLTPPETATRCNPYREWIGALIRGDAFGYVHPGNPAGAARLALVDARLTHTANGVYGEMWAAGLVAAALASTDMEDAFTTARALVPARSRLGATLADIQSLRTGGASATEALDHVDAEYSHYPWVHTVNNAALISIGLLWGRTFVEAVGLAIAGGADTDSTAATVGSVYGALHGSSAIPEDLVGDTHVHVRSAIRDFDRVTIDELTERTLRLV
ncbi:ADP-ribosylglycohydrolase family protein [Brachybacterium sp. YJGR34]|uniref:ADP-ribosylglycohydrolase family protein n=1 Tax=Brachybacterium sp. YJGR34 TaxID=2059911 RepID=UPI000E0A2868|nr:ADP-ribosylglycohydrolase family protein [Brachybacterium sp. YJGR34]